MAQGRNPGRLLVRVVALAVACALAVAVVSTARNDRPRPGQSIGLFTSLPILWPETQDLSDLLRPDAPPHWARAVIEANGRLQPLDTLAGKDGKLPLPGDALLIVAQPRALSPLENVALDDWVRSGGRVLLFADPMLTARSAFPLGDRRRPQDVVLLSPILSRWGLELQFADEQSYGERRIALFGASLPVNLPGSFVPAGGGCAIESGGIAARCSIGSGRVVAVADAALLEDGEGNRAHRAMLQRLISRLVR